MSRFHEREVFHGYEPSSLTYLSTNGIDSWHTSVTRELFIVVETGELTVEREHHKADQDHCVPAHFFHEREW